MRKIIKTEKKYSTRVLLKWTLIVIMHYFAFLTYILIFRAYDIAIHNNIFYSNQSNPFSKLFELILLYFLTVGPIINAVSQIYYYKSGSLLSKTILWANSLVLIITMPVYLIV